MKQQHPDGIHHIAVMAADMKEHLAFFCDVMGFPLVALFDMHGVPGGKHAFLKMTEHSYFSIVELAGVAEIPRTLGVTHAGSGAGPSAAGTMQHLAFRAPDETAMLALRDRIRSHGVPAIGPIGHGFCQSIYFAGPDQLTLEVACPAAALDPARWIDPAVLAECGIDAATALRFASPAPTVEGGPVPQPAYDPAKPHMAYPEATYRAILAAPDAAITAQGSYNEPPVAALVAAGAT